ncbi:MAG: ATP-binding cassette domain-containing protein [Treponema sp.]|nr:ATP-binding cassette domain-containing protein [Treponema sp.]
MVEISNLTFKYEGSQKNALENINLHVNKGDFLGIIGESGAGKTTLCSAINALIPHHFKGDYYGSVKVDGQDTFDIAPGLLALKVGSVFQDIDSQMLSTFVEDEILFGLENFGVPKDQIERRLSQALKDIGIEDLRYREIASLSGGQKQKVAIASILALEPEVLLLDEPTGELDPASSRQIFQLLGHLNREKGMTVIVVEQKIMLLCEFARTLAVMEGGKLAACGPVREVLQTAEKLEEKGVNIPRVVTLSRRLSREGLIPENIPFEKRLALNAKEAAELVGEICKGMPGGAQNAAALEDSAEKHMKSFDGKEPERDSENKTIIEFKNVNFSYRNDANIRDISVEIKKGDFVAIIGSNGAGKSTFSKLCNGLLKPSSGDVLVEGDNTKKVKTSKLAKKIAFLFQNPDRQICCNTVREEIAFSLKNIGLSEEEVKNRVEKTLQDFAFDPDAEPFSLSRGQRQRLCLACLIAVRSDILILDEPTTGLDYKECIELMEKIRELNKEGTTVLMVCHDMEVVLDYASRVLVMTGGRLIADGATKWILGDDELLAQARLLQPQICETATKLGKEYQGIFSVDELIAKISA